MCFFFFQAEDGIRYLVRSRGLGDVYKRQILMSGTAEELAADERVRRVYLGQNFILRKKTSSNATI